MLNLLPLIMFILTMLFGFLSVGLAVYYLVLNVKSEDEIKKLKLHKPLIVLINLLLFIDVMMMWICLMGFKGSAIGYAKAMTNVFFTFWMLVIVASIVAIVYLKKNKSVFWDVSRDSVKKLINVSALGAFLCKLVGAMA